MVDGERSPHKPQQRRVINQCFFDDIEQVPLTSVILEILPILIHFDADRVTDN